LALLGKSNDEIAQIETAYSRSDAADSGAKKSQTNDQIDRRIMIRAPIAGTVVDRKLGPGQYIKPDSADPLYMISDLSTLWVTVNVYENDLSRVHVGAPVDVRVAAYPDKDFPARIAAINPTVDPSTRTVHVRCTVLNPNRLLKPEMFASIRIADAVKQRVLTVPSSAILTEGDRSYLLVEESAGRFSRGQVRSGREIEGSTVVEDRLHANDRGVTSGVLLLSNLEVSKP
jgi:cobalt-zinc-cadmium efflux system membrane fusion protein